MNRFAMKLYIFNWHRCCNLWLALVNKKQSHLVLQLDCKGQTGKAKSGDDPIDAIGGFISDPNARLLRICHPCVIIG